MATTQKNQQAKGQQFDETIISSILINGDISKLSPQQKVDYYSEFCNRLGLDPLSQPFSLLKLNGREILYCNRSGAQQLSKLHKVSHDIKARETVGGCYVVTTQAALVDGRHTESIGAVSIDNLRGDNLCNAMMKAETKSKRRATLDLLGLGILDETEVGTISGAQPIPSPMPSNGNQGGNGGQVPPAAGTAAPAAPAGSNGPQNDQQEAVARVSPFKTKYETADEIQKVLDEAQEIKDIANLYYINAEIVEANPNLKGNFSNRKNEFYNNNQAI